MDLVIQLEADDSLLADATVLAGSGATVAASRFVVELYSRQGSDPFNPSRGTAWPSALDTQGTDIATLTDVALVSVEAAASSVKRAQRLARSRPSEQLDAVVFHGVELDEDVVVLTVSIVTADGLSARFAIRGGR